MHFQFNTQTTVVHQMAATASAMNLTSKPRCILTPQLKKGVSDQVGAAQALEVNSESVTGHHKSQNPRTQKRLRRNAECSGGSTHETTQQSNLTNTNKLHEHD